MPRHVKQGDLVIVTTGVHKGKTGKVLGIVTGNSPNRHRVIVEGVNVVNRHVRPSQQNPQGGRIEKTLPIHISNVSPISTVSGKPMPTRVRFEKRANGEKVRVAVKGGAVLSILKKASK